jgi:uncharacterized protein YegJ (DUF2314 family)
VKRFLAAAFAVLALCGCGPSKPDTLVGEFDEQEMDAAIARARAETDLFLGELAKKTGESHAVKAAIKDGQNTEYFWLTDLTYRDGQFEGTINNEPGMVKNVKLGQKWNVKKDEIADWLYLRDGKMYGNYTMRPLLKSMPAAEAAKFRAMFAVP